MFDASRLRRQDWGIAAGAVVHLVCLLLPWFTFGGVTGLDVSTNGFSDRVLGSFGLGYSAGLTVSAWLLLLVAAAAALSPAFPRVQVPRQVRVGTAALAVLAFVLTLVVWVQTLMIDWNSFGPDIGTSHVSVAALAALLVAAAVAVLAVLDALPELRRLRQDRAAVQPSGVPGWPGAPAPGAQPGWAQPEQHGWAPPPPHGQPYGGGPQPGGRPPAPPSGDPHPGS